MQMSFGDAFQDRMSYGHPVPQLPFRRLPGRSSSGSDSDDEEEVAPKRRRLCSEFCYKAVLHLK